MPRSHRVAGALIGSAVGDALGAPFEFGPPGQFTARFPADARGTATEMCGEEPGRFTDDTQLALLLGTSLVERGGLDEADVFARFRDWALADPPDIGRQTRAVLRSTPAAIRFARAGTATTMDAARRISALTHGDPAAGEGCALFHELLRVALDGGDPLAAVPAGLQQVPDEHRARWATVLAADWTPDQATESNGAVWPTLGSAVWALRRGRSFAEVLRLVIDLGGDTDTLAAPHRGHDGGRGDHSRAAPLAVPQRVERHLHRRTGPRALSPARASPRVSGQSDPGQGCSSVRPSWVPQVRSGSTSCGRK